MQAANGMTVADDIDIAALLRALNHRKTWILGFATFAAVLSYVALGFIPPRYASEVRILIEREENSYKRPADSNSLSQQSVRTDQETVSSQVQVLLSRDLAMGVVNDLGLENNPEFNASSPSGFITGRLKDILSNSNSHTPAQRKERVLNKFLDRLNVYQIQSSRVIAVEFESQDPEIAAKAVNKLAELYLTWQQGEKLKQTREASQWLGAQIKQLTKQVEQAELAADKFRTSTGLIEGRDNTSLDAQQLSELNSQIILAKAQRTEAEARAALIKKMLKEKGDVAGAADVLNSKLIQRLVEQQARVQRSLAETSVTLLPSHPRIKALKSELADLKRQIRTEANKVVSSLQSEVQIAGAREASLRESLNELKATASKNNQSQIRLRALEREIKGNRELLESYLARYRDASARSEQGSVPSHASIVSRGHVATEPSFPRKGPISLLAFAAVAFIGLAFTIARELLIPEQQVAPAPTRSLRMPAHAESERQSGGVVAVESRREFADWLADPQNRNIVIVPLTHEHGAVRTAFAGLRDLAGKGRSVLAVDALPNAGGLAQMMGLPAGPGIHELAAGTADFAEAVRRDPNSDLQLISGNLGEHGSRGFDRTGFGSIARALESAYDHVAYLAGPDEALAVMKERSLSEPMLVLLRDPECSVEETLWQADNIFSDSVDQPPLVIVAELTRGSRMKMPFGLMRRAS